MHFQFVVVDAKHSALTTCQSTFVQHGVDMLRMILQGVVVRETGQTVATFVGVLQFLVFQIKLLVLESAEAAVHVA